MDEMRINSRFLKDIIEKIIRKNVQKKLGFDICITLNDLSVAMEENIAHLHLNIDGDLDKNDIKKLLLKIGL